MVAYRAVLLCDMRLLVLSNPHSTSHTQQLLRAVIPPLRQVATLHSVHTQHQGHARELCAGLTREDYDAVIAIGGDGTVNEVLEGLLGSDVDKRPAPDHLPRLGIIPSGSANVFARALGFPNSPRQAAVMLAQLLRAHAYRRVPVGRINNRWFCVNAGFGLDAEVVSRMEHIREAGGLATPWRYSVVTFQVWQLLRRISPKVHFEATLANGATESGEVPFALVSNTNPWSYAGPVPLAPNPDHEFEDGFAFYAVQDMSGPVGFLTLAHMVGLPVRDFYQDQRRFRETRVDDITSLTLSSPTKLNWQLDGELGGKTTKLSLRFVPHALDVISPENPGQ